MSWLKKKSTHNTKSNKQKQAIGVLSTHFHFVLKTHLWWWFYNSMNILKTTELYTFKGEFYDMWIISQ